jgi:hypothetical protein
LGIVISPLAGAGVSFYLTHTHTLFTWQGLVVVHQVCARKVPVGLLITKEQLPPLDPILDYLVYITGEYYHAESRMCGANAMLVVFTWPVVMCFVGVIAKYKTTKRT